MISNFDVRNNWVNIFESYKTNNDIIELRKSIIKLIFEIDQNDYSVFATSIRENYEIIVECLENPSLSKLEILKIGNINPKSFMRYYTTKHQFCNYLIINNITDDLYDLIFKFLNNREKILQRKSYIYLFENLFNIVKMSSSMEFSDKTFFIHYHFFNNDKNCNKDRDVVNSLINFYLYLLKGNIGTFEILSQSILTYDLLITKLNSGFRIVKHSYLLDIPKFDRFMFVVSNNTGKHRVGQLNRILSFDSTFIKNESLKNAYKFYIWLYENENIYLRYNTMSYIDKFIYLIDEIGNNIITVKIKHILEFKNNSIANLSDPSKAVALSKVKNFLKFIEQENFVNVEPTAYKLFQTTNTHSKSDKRMYSYIESEQIIQAIEKFIQKSRDTDEQLLYKLYNIIIKVQRITPLRVSTILSLKLNCIEKISDNSYILKTPSKTKEIEEYNITKKVKELINEVIILTNKIRMNADDLIKDSLFIHRYKRYSKISVINPATYGTVINKFCKELNIKPIRQTGIRNLFNNQVSSYVINNYNNDSLISQLTKHSLNVHFKYYDSYDIREICEKLYLIKIGDLNLNGKVKLFKSEESNELSNSSGYCISNKCLDNSLFDCMLCKYFETTLDNEQFFTNAIDKIDQEIYYQEIVHEKEFLVTKKRILVAYYAKILELKIENETR